MAIVQRTVSLRLLSLLLVLLMPACFPTMEHAEPVAQNNAAQAPSSAPPPDATAAAAPANSASSAPSAQADERAEPQAPSPAPAQDQSATQSANAKPAAQANKQPAKAAAADGDKARPQKPKKKPAPEGAYLRLIAPNGAEKWPLGSAQKIEWEARNLDGDIEVLLYKFGKYLGTINYRVPVEAGEWTWKIPRNQGAGGNYSIRIVSKDYQKMHDFGEAEFDLVYPQ